ncbi:MULTISPECIES: hypothetical protein [unclassified Nocardioides]|uniref:hypothetical protein n=1 Tax=unclassified Nocardioides TaxID=2615069 RepID=UPI0030148EB6
MSEPSPWILRIMVAAEDLEDGHDAYLCPGCESWQVEYTYDPADHPGDGGFAMMVFMGTVETAEALARAHRAECPPFDLLAGLRGVPLDV